MYSDLDVELLFYESSASWMRIFATNIQYFLDDERELLANGDHSSPVNAGVWIVKPSMEEYRRGISLLKREFNLSHGFTGCRPDQLPLRFKDSSKMFRKNTWDFVAGNADQGLLTAVYYLADKMRRPNGTLRVHHFWAKQTPWAQRNCLRYFLLPATHSYKCAAPIAKNLKCGGTRAHVV